MNLESSLQSAWTRIVLMFMGSFIGRIQNVNVSSCQYTGIVQAIKIVHVSLNCDRRILLKFLGLLRELIF